MTEQTETKAKAGATIIPVTPFQQNCTLLWSEATRQAVVVDPGGDVPDILEAIKKNNVTVKEIWLTHGHIDHVGGAADLRDALKVEIVGPHIADKDMLDHVVESGARFGITGVRNFAPDRWLSEGEQVSIGDLTFDILHCPGHSPGSVVFVSKELGFALVGDVLFAGSVGRTDLPGGNHATLIDSIAKKLLPLGDDIGFICGHGPARISATSGKQIRFSPTSEFTVRPAACRWPTPRYRRADQLFRLMWIDGAGAGTPTLADDLQRKQPGVSFRFESSRGARRSGSVRLFQCFVGSKRNIPYIRFCHSAQRRLINKVAFGNATAGLRQLAKRPLL